MTAEPLPRVRLEVFHHLFAAVSEEMGSSLARSAFSPNIKERRDFSCALFDGDGRMIAQAAHLPVHLGATPLCVAAAMQRIDMQPGDCVVLNDPFEGGTHLPDVTLVSPVFLPGDSRPSFYCANRAHHADIGGAHPGSMAPMRDIHGEGIRIPPTKLVRGGEIDPELLRLLLANMRVPREREGDLLAQWSANRIGEARLLRMVEEHGREVLLASASGLLDWSEELMRKELATLPAGTWSFEDELETRGPAGAERSHLRLDLRIDPKSEPAIVFDFTRTDDQVEGPVNTTRAVAVSSVFYVLRLLLDVQAPTNEGMLRPVEILTRSGSIVDARYPASVAAGNVETSQRLVDTLLGALASAMPDRIPAASAGTMSNFTFGFSATEERDALTHYETIAGGAGAGPNEPGAHALQTHMTNTRNTPIEALENEVPVRVESYTIRRGSGGAGRFPGGDGILKCLEFLEPAQVAWIAERQLAGPWGLAGGARGEAGAARALPPDGGDAILLPGKAARSVSAGERIELSTPGGGGYGSPDE